jgi:DNA invertase Pin-like site-specific DNA recombinase
VTEKRPRAAIYLRQSLDKTGERAAVRRQLEACQALCVAKDYVIYGQPYEDNDTSATKLRPRKAYTRLLEDAEAGRFDVIVVHHIDRLARRVRDLEDVLDIGLPISTAVGDMDLSTDMGRLMARILGAVAQAEVERKAARQKAGNRQRAAHGVPHFAPNPFGYRREVVRNEADKVVSATYVIQPVEAEAVRQAYELLLAGATLRGIAQRWNESGLRTSQGAPWTGWSVRRRLKSPVYAGLAVYDGEEVATGNWTPLVTEDVWRRAVDLLNSPDRRTTLDQTKKYLLPNLALCGVDGCTLKVATGRSHRGVRTYVCPSKHMSRVGEPVDALIEALVIARLSRPDAASLFTDDTQPDAQTLRDKARELRAKLSNYASMLAEDDMTPEQFTVASARVRVDLAELEAQLADGGRGDVLRDLVDGDAAALWQGLDLAQRRAVISALMTVTLLPVGRGRKTFDPDTVQVTWR